MPVDICTIAVGCKLMNTAYQYHRSVQRILDRIVETQMPALERAARMIADTIQRDGIVYSLGSGHSFLIAMELHCRAGGLSHFDVIYDRTFGRAERLAGYADVLLESYPISASDLLIVISNSGRNPLPVEMAMRARERGIATIGLTSLAHSRAVSSRAPGGKRLFEVCDVVIDNCGIAGDAGLDIGNGTPVRMGPTSTLAGAFIANCLSGLAAEELISRGVHPPVLVSANIDEGDSSNQPLMEMMKRRIRGV
jgi:uncharacterized phosphosugar-binding protein